MATYVGTTGNDTRTGSLNARHEFINFGFGVDVVTGGRYDDLFRFSVDQGKDVIDGGLGLHDLLHYGSADRGVTVDLGAGHVWATFYRPGTVTVAPSDLGPNGTAGGTFVTMVPYQVTVADVTGIEDVTGSIYKDVITGTIRDNILSGGKGEDELHGGWGNDTLYGGDNNDTLFGDGGANTVDGGKGDDKVLLQLEHTAASADDDTLFGGDGIDTLSFSVSASLSGSYGVVVSLRQGLVESIRYNTNGSSSVPRDEAVIDGFENVEGTNQTDVIEGNSGDNRINGNSGDDVLFGLRGADILTGGRGRDLFYASDDHFTDEINGGDQIDTVTYEDTPLETMSRGVRVTLADDGAAGTTYVFYSVEGAAGSMLQSFLEDRLYDLENVIGSDFGDTVIGNNAANTLTGGWGEDTLEGGGNGDILNGGRDADTLTGGTGRDTFRFSDPRDSGSRADTITDFASGSDIIDFSPFYSQAAASHNLNAIEAANLLPPTFIGSENFSGAGNEIRITTTGAGEWLIELDAPPELTDLSGGGGVVDVEIIVRGSAPTQNDFVF